MYFLGGGTGVPLQWEQDHQAVQLQGQVDYVPCPVTHQVCPSGDAGYCQENIFIDFKLILCIKKFKSTSF